MNIPPETNARTIKGVLWGFLAGLPVGIFIGWSLSGLVGFLIRFILFIVAVVIIAGVVIMWKNSRQPPRDGRPDVVDVQWRDPGDTPRQ